MKKITPLVRYTVYFQSMLQLKVKFSIYWVKLLAKESLIVVITIFCVPDLSTTRKCDDTEYIKLKAVGRNLRLKKHGIFKDLVLVWFQKFSQILMKWNQRCYFLKRAEFFYSTVEYRRPSTSLTTTFLIQTTLQWRPRPSIWIRTTSTWRSKSRPTATAIETATPRPTSEAQFLVPDWGD